MNWTTCPNNVLLSGLFSLGPDKSYQNASASCAVLQLMHTIYLTPPPPTPKCLFSFSARHLQLHFVLVGVGPPFNTQLSQSWPGTNGFLYWLPFFFPPLHSSPELPFILPQWGQCVSRLQSLTAVTCDRWVKVLPMIRKSSDCACFYFALHNYFFFFCIALHCIELHCIALLKDDI